ncbi:hypothetical protein D3C71_1616280 [compost metagenome]
MLATRHAWSPAWLPWPGGQQEWCPVSRTSLTPKALCSPRKNWHGKRVFPWWCRKRPVPNSSTCLIKAIPTLAANPIICCWPTMRPRCVNAMACSTVSMPTVMACRRGSKRWRRWQFPVLTAAATAQRPSHRIFNRKNWSAPCSIALSRGWRVPMTRLTRL